MVAKDVQARKQEYRAKLEKYLQDYRKILIVGADNVGSSQMQKIRLALRGKAVLLMGKNTMIRKVLREMIPSNPKLERLMPIVYGNIGFVFTNGDLNEVRTTIANNKVPAPARVGTQAPSDVWVPAGPTGLDPGQTGFFQALNIATKIVKGAVEIINDVHLITAGARVNPSHVSLLSKLDIKPFFYGMAVQNIYEDGAVFSAAVLDITPADMLNKFFASVSVITAVSLRAGLPNIATLPHSFARAFKNLVAIAVAADIDFEEATPYKEALKDPAAWAAKHGGGAAAAAPPAAAPAAAAGKPAPAAAKGKEPEPEEEEVMGFGGGLFGDD